jgi:ketol-acid reductoisomerase
LKKGTTRFNNLKSNHWGAGLNNSHGPDDNRPEASRSFDYLDLPLEEKMEKTLEEIRSGAFSREWQEEQRTGMKNFHALDEVRKQLPISEWQSKTRAVFKNIGKNLKKA